MMSTDTYKPGDVIRNADGHPAVVLLVDSEEWPTVVLPASGVDARRQVCPPLLFDRVTSKIEIGRAQRVAREEWAAGNRWEPSRKTDA